MGEVYLSPNPLHHKIFRAHCPVKCCKLFSRSCREWRNINICLICSPCSRLRLLQNHRPHPVPQSTSLVKIVSLRMGQINILCHSNVQSMCLVPIVSFWRWQINLLCHGSVQIMSSVKKHFPARLGNHCFQLAIFGLQFEKGMWGWKCMETHGFDGHSNAMRAASYKTIKQLKTYNANKQKNKKHDVDGCRRLHHFAARHPRHPISVSPMSLSLSPSISISLPWPWPPGREAASAAASAAAAPAEQRKRQVSS